MQTPVRLPEETNEAWEARIRAFNNARYAAIFAVLAAEDGGGGEPGGEIWRRRHLASIRIAIEAHGLRWPRPAKVEEQLELLRREARALRQRLSALDAHAQTLLNQEADTIYRRRREAMRSNDMEAVLATFDEPNPPTSEWMCPSLEATLDRLDAALPAVIERTIWAGAELEETGRPPNWPARLVALAVARYLRDVTGAIPSLWTGSPPSGPYARALGGCFRAMGITADIRRAGEWALSKLSEN